MSNKATCPACGSHLSGVYEALEGEIAGCPVCGLPGSVMRQIEDARRAHADAGLTRQLEEALVRAGKAEAELARLRRLMFPVRQVFAEWEGRDPLAGKEWQRNAGW